MWGEAFASASGEWNSLQHMAKPALSVVEGSASADWFLANEGRLGHVLRAVSNRCGHGQLRRIILVWDNVNKNARYAVVAITDWNIKSIFGKIAREGSSGCDCNTTLIFTTLM